MDNQAKNYYWNLLNTVCFLNSYYAYYGEKARTINSYLKNAPALFSAVAMVLWAAYPEQKSLWSGMILISQLASIIFNLLPYSERVSTVRYLIPQLEVLLSEMVKYWYAIEQGTASPEDIFAELANFEVKLNHIKTLFSVDIVFPSDEKIEKKANERFKKELEFRFHIFEEGEENKEETILGSSTITPNPCSCS